MSFDNNSVSGNLRNALGRYRGLKALFIQDEYRRVDEAIAAMREIGINLLFTCVPEAEIEKVYPAERLPGVTKINVLTGYVPEALLDRKVPPYAARAIDVGYRARKVPAWLGDLGQEKYRIGARFCDDAAADGLVLDISFREEDRIYGDGWIDFVCRCKAVLGVESGASVFDFSGDVQRAVDAHTAEQPSVEFETLQELYFKDLEGKIALNQISPRCFEAAALRTLMILYEGDYSGRMIAGRHYLALRKNHSNHADIVAVLKDEARAQDIIDTAYREIACNPANTFAAFVREFDQAMSDAFKPSLKARLAPLDDLTFQQRARPPLATRVRWFRRRTAEGAYRFLFAKVLGRARPETRETVHAWLKYCLRPFRGAPRPLR